MVAALLQRGADPRQRTRRGVTPLLLAAQLGHRRVGEMLLSLRSTRRDVDYESADGRTALTAAAGGGHEEMVKMLIRKGERVKLSHKPTHTSHPTRSCGGVCAVLTRTARAPPIRRQRDAGDAARHHCPARRLPLRPGRHCARSSRRWGSAGRHEPAGARVAHPTVRCAARSSDPVCASPLPLTPFLFPLPYTPPITGCWRSARTQRAPCAAFGRGSRSGGGRARRAGPCGGEPPSCAHPPWTRRTHRGGRAARVGWTRREAGGEACRMQAARSRGRERLSPAERCAGSRLRARGSGA